VQRTNGLVAPTFRLATRENLLTQAKARRDLVVFSLQVCALPFLASGPGLESGCITVPESFLDRLQRCLPCRGRFPLGFVKVQIDLLKRAIARERRVHPLLSRIFENGRRARQRLERRHPAAFELRELTEAVLVIRREIA
jgi:hypothetical protein